LSNASKLQFKKKRKKKKKTKKNSYTQLLSVENLSASLQSFWQRAENFLGFQ